MTDLTLSKDEMQMLLQIINVLTTALDGTQSLDEAMAKIHLLLPFKKCVLLHERSTEPSSASLMYEFTDGCAGTGCQSFRGEVPLRIRHYLECFKRIDTFQNAFSWRSAADNRECTQEATDFLKRTGASHGIVGSINSLGGKKSDGATLIQLQYTDGQFASAHLWFVNIIVFYLHIYFIHCTASLHHPHARNNLTFREKEVLQWVVQGKTSWEVGRILSMSERTVKFHLQNIYAKLNVVNRAQAVSMASRLQLI